MKLSAMITRRVKLASELEGVLATHGPAAAEGLDDFFAPVAAGGPALDVAAYLDALRRKVAWWRERLTTLDLTHQEEETARGDWRRGEKELAKSVYGLLVNLRRVTRGLLEEEDLVVLGLAGTVSQDPVTVQRQGDKAWQRFQKENLPVGSEDWPRLRKELKAMADRLGSESRALSKSSKELRRAQRRVESAASRKRRGIKAFDREYLWIAKFAEMLLRMAGLDDAADRVKPRARRLDRNVG